MIFPKVKLLSRRRVLMQSKASILLVEDNPNDAVLFQRALKKANSSNPLHIVEHGAKAVSYLSGEGHFADREKYPFPKLIVLDLTLPQMPGLEFLQWLRAKSSEPKLPVVVLTGRTGPTEAKKAFQLGCSAYFVKPHEAAELEQIVGTIQDQWLD
jgi:CheY-like chemotaxis protein